MALRRASIAELKKGKEGRGASRIVVVMRYFPRFTKRELIDEYAPELAPTKELFSEFKAKDREIRDHNRAFSIVRYEERFNLSKEGLEKLRELSVRSRAEDVVLICQCESYDRCHCDLLLIWAHQKFQAPIGRVIFDYPDFAPAA